MLTRNSELNFLRCLRLRFLFMTAYAVFRVPANQSVG